MVHTTIEQVEDYANVTYDPEARERVSLMIEWAERLLRRWVGHDFYNNALPLSDASLDWIEVTARIVARYLIHENEEFREAMARPYSSETLGDYRYWLKDEDGRSLGDDPRIVEIVAFHTYRPLPITSGVIVVGPTRTRKLTGVTGMFEGAEEPDVSMSWPSWWS